ncbi:chromosome segregation protein SMC [Candidatus Bathyarchaeota archaeon]|nr:chromosome segregation protein SMC [Candidatus Bathyarchaeota archaeon]
MIRNFKSFSGQIKLNFQSGFNIITGPNGSGKSNIIDAIQFVLGELASKRMRVPDFGGLIYDGAGETDIGKSQIAQVTIYFDNSDRGLASDRNQVSIGRKVDRQGKSDYYLNGKKTSRKIVLDLLQLAGITPGGYNIVQQGTATRLSDLTPSERMRALEDLIGIKEYDEKKSEAKIRLSEAERKIEIASARIDEVRKRVSELERQRNDALRYNHLNREEKRLTAVKLSYQINQLEEKISVINEQLRERQIEVTKLEEEKKQLREEREIARNRVEEFNREAAERGNTKLPMLKSDLVGKKTLRDNINNRLKEITIRISYLEKAIYDKQIELNQTDAEILERKKELDTLSQNYKALTSELELKKEDLQKTIDILQNSRSKTSENQKQLEDLTERLIPMQETLTGLEIEINLHKSTNSNLEEKIHEQENKKEEYEKTTQSLREKLDEFANIKAQEAENLEEMLSNLENQIDRQKSLRNTIENANLLAKQAETTITEFSAKRDLWKQIVVVEKALERIREIGEAGALEGYHGPVKSLIKINSTYQRAINSSAEGWMNAVVIDYIDVVTNCIDRLKKTKLGMTRFIPLDHLKKNESLPKINDERIVGPLLDFINCDEIYLPVAGMIWGDTYLVKDSDGAIKANTLGYRAVTIAGDIFEPKGGIMGGYYRRPPDYSKLVPTEESIDSLSKTIKSLRQKLKTRMTDLKASGGNLRGFSDYMEESKKRITRIDLDVAETNERLVKLEKTIVTVIDIINKYKGEQESNFNLILTLEERKQKIQQQLDDVKQEINLLKEIKPSDLTDLEIKQSSVQNEIINLQNQIRDIENSQSVQNGFVSRVLSIRLEEASEQLNKMKNEKQSLEQEHIQDQEQLVEIDREIEIIELDLNSLTDEVEATSNVMEQQQKTLRIINQRMEDLERRREVEDKRINQITLEVERLKLQGEQKLDELALNGFEDKISTLGIEFELIESRIQQIKTERNNIGAINQLALDQYNDYMLNYKNQSTRINELEEEKLGILKFIDEVEREKTDHFMTAFNEVCENFSTIFGKITGGGDGRLELQKPEDPFSGGVDLYLQFPGKPMRLGSGASGGERSVAAIAYLLAIQKFLRAPFYVFDEVDAHLDDLNTSRLSEVLKESAVDAQFLMISLKDVMVHNADRIYGVFSQGGKSRVLALPMKNRVESVI